MNGHSKGTKYMPDQANTIEANMVQLAQLARHTDKTQLAQHMQSKHKQLPLRLSPGVYEPPIQVSLQLIRREHGDELLHRPQLLCRRCPEQERCAGLLRPRRFHVVVTPAKARAEAADLGGWCGGKVGHAIGGQGGCEAGHLSVIHDLHGICPSMDGIGRATYKKGFP